MAVSGWEEWRKESGLVLVCVCAYVELTESLQLSELPENKIKQRRNGGAGVETGAGTPSHASFSVIPTSLSVCCPYLRSQVRESKAQRLALSPPESSKSRQ